MAAGLLPSDPPSQGGGGVLSESKGMKLQFQGDGKTYKIRGVCVDVHLNADFCQLWQGRTGRNLINQEAGVSTQRAQQTSTNHVDK